MSDFFVMYSWFAYLITAGFCIGSTEKKATNNKTATIVFILSPASLPFVIGLGVALMLAEKEKPQ